MSLLFFLLLILRLSHYSSSTVIIGATYTSSAAASTGVLSTLGLDAVRLLNPDAASVRAFLYSNTTLLLTLPNALVPIVAANRSAASDWLSAIIIPFFPRAKINAISVGDASLLDSSPGAVSLLPAARNLRAALADLGVRGVSVSATFSAASVLSSFFPPSSAQFRQPAARNVVIPVLHFLSETNSSLMVTLHPYHVYRAHPEIPVGFALFQDQPFNFRDDLGTGVRYRNLFDVMADAVVCATEAAGLRGLPLVVAETGWPTGSTNAVEVDANLAYAEVYVRGLVRHLRSGAGTPLRKDGVAATYLYKLIDQAGGHNEGDGANRSWGILYPNFTAKYDIDFSSGLTLSVCLWKLLVLFVWCVFDVSTI